MRLLPKLIRVLGVGVVGMGTALAQMAAPPSEVTTILFGSCAKQDKPQPIWEAILRDQPDLFVFLGDNIYGDSDDPAVLQKKYEQLAAVEGFAKLRAACPVVATWDDHDYGRNDAGAEFPIKRESEQIFLDFFGEPVDSPRRAREGVYTAYEFGPAERRVQLILLDTRYFRSPLRRAEQSAPSGAGRPGPYTANPDDQATILGEAQWAWLEAELRKPARVRVIASSIQVVAEEHGYEKWQNFPHERERLFDVIARTGAGGVLFISGDRHSAELSCWRPDGAPVAGSAQRAAAATERASRLRPGYPLYDLTSSALNQPRGFQNEWNAWRLGCVYFEPNYGRIAIDWNAADPVVRLEIRSMAGKPVIVHELPLSELAPARR